MDEKLKIFFCEDDENLGMLLKEYLQAKNYITDLFSDGEAGVGCGRLELAEEGVEAPH